MIVWKFEMKSECVDVKIFFQSYDAAVNARVFQIRREFLQAENRDVFLVFKKKQLDFKMTQMSFF